MRDINLVSRDLFGNVSFGLKSISIQNNNFDVLLQKIQILILSESKQTYFSRINGGDITTVGKFNFDSTGSGDFKAIFSSNLLAIKQKIKEDEILNNIPFDDRIKNLELKDILFDKVTGSVILSLSVSTNTSNQIFKLPIK